MASRHDVVERQRAGSSVGRGYVFEALEPRILLSADPLGAAVGDALHGGGLDDRLPHELRAPETFDALIETAAVTLDASDATAPDPSTGLPPPVDLEGLAVLHAPRDAAAESQQAVSREVLFVDAGVADHQPLVDELAGGDDGRSFEVILLDAGRDGVVQITEALAGRDRIDAVHILSHGAEGGVRLGDSWLTQESLSAYADNIAGWGGALTDEADLLFYGCDLAASVEGRDLVERMSALTGADVAASDDLTGHSSLGGDWELEFASGRIESTVFVGATAQASWSGTLATILDQFNSIAYNGSDGTLPWSNDWQEIGESDGPDMGRVLAGYNALSEQGLLIWKTPAIGAWREADLSGFTTATLSFDWALLSTDAGDSVSLEISTDGGLVWNPIDTFDGPADHGALQPASYDISAYIDSDTRIKFESTTFGDNDEFFVDNVQIELSASAPNDAPVLDSTGTMTLTDVAEDSTNPPGNPVAAIISSAGGDRITDIDSGAVEGIAVIGVDDTDGTWEYSINGGASWDSFVSRGVADGSTDDTAAVLLEDTTLVRFVPDAGYTGSAGDITFRAWDQTSGANGDFGVNVSINGGTTAFSTATETATLAVVPASGVTNLVPGNQNTDEDNSLIFSTGNGNAIVVDDGSASDPILRTALSVTNGTLTLASTVGLTFENGADGTSAMTIVGLESAINNALDGLTFAPTGDYNGPADLQVTTDLSADLEGHYTFDNPGDPGNDASPAGANDGLITGATPTVDGTHGNVLAFDGDDSVQIPGLFANPTDVTLAAWVNLDAGITRRDVISLGDNLAIRLDELGSGVVGFYFDGTTWQHTASGAFINGTGWHHIAFTFDDANDEQVLYIDGVASATTAHSAAISYTLGTDTYLGRNGDTAANYLHGSIEDARIYERALTASEISALFQEQTSDTDNIAITVNPVNDAPAVINNGLTVSEGSIGNVITNAHLNENDVDDAGAGLTYSVTVLPGNGTLRINGTAAIANDTFTQADIDAGIITYDHNGSETISDSLDFSLADGGEDGAVPVTGTFNITVSPVNDQLGATNLTQTKGYTEGAASVALDDILVTDADTGETVTASLTLADPGAGALTTSGTATYTAGTGLWSITDTIANVNMALANVAFVPALNHDQNTSIAVAIADGGENGTVAATGTIDLNVTAVNDPPAFVGLDAIRTYVEGGPAVTLDNNATVTDVELDSLNGGAGDYTGAQLTVVRNGGPDTDDVFNIPSGGNLTVGAATISAGGNVIANFTLAGGQLQISFVNTGTVPTQALVDEVLQAITYENTNPAPPASVTIDYTLDDGNSGAQGSGGALQGTGSVTVNINPTNDTPTATNVTQVKNYTEGAASVALDDIVVTDLDAGELITATLTLANPSAGALTTTGTATYDSGTGVWTITESVANVNAALANVAFVPTPDNDLNTSITTHVEDAATTGPADGSITLNVTPVNDQLTATNLTQTQGYTEGAASVALDDFVVTDVDTVETITASLTLADPTAGALTVSGSATYTAGTGLWTITDTVANVNAALASVAFVPATDYDQNTSIAVTIADGGENGTLAATGTIDLNVTAVNDPPAFTGLDGTPTYVEGGAAVALDGNATVGDTELDALNGGAGNYTGAVLILARNGGANAEDVFDIPSGGSLSVGAGTITAAGNVIATFTNSGGQLQISFENNGTLPTTALVDEVLQAITYGNSNAAPPPSVQIDYTLDDGNSGAQGTGGALQAAGSVTVTITATNTVPGASNLNQTKAYTEGAASVALDDIVVTDPDAGETITASLTLANPAAGTLTTSGAATYTAGTGVWTLTDTVANVNSALANVAFSPAPDNDLNTTIAVHIEDAATSGPADGTINLNVTPVNDQLGATNLTQTKGYTEDAASVALDDIVVTDVDTGETVTASLTLADPAAGALTTSGTATYTTGTGLWTITDTVANVNAALANVAFVPALNHDQNTSIAVAIADGGENGTVAATGTIDLNVTPVADAPIVNGLTLNVDEDAANGAVLGAASATDPDGDGFTFAITTGDPAGLFAIDSATGQITVADNATLDYESIAQYNLTVEVTDDSTGNLTGAATVTVNVNDVSEGPTTPDPGPPPDPGVGPDPITPPDPGDPGPPDPTSPPDDDAEPETTDSGDDGADDSGGGGGSGVGGGGENPADSSGDALADPDESLLEEFQDGAVDSGEPGDGGSGPVRSTLESLINSISIAPSALGWVFGTAMVSESGQPGLLSVDDLISVVKSGRFVNDLDNLREDLADEMRLEKSVVGSTIVASTGLSVGYVMWLLRGGVLISSMLSSMPAWRLVDPLPVLANTARRAEEEEDDSLESLVKERPDVNKPRHEGDSPDQPEGKALN